MPAVEVAPDVAAIDARVDTFEAGARARDHARKAVWESGVGDQDELPPDDPTEFIEAEEVKLKAARPFTEKLQPELADIRQKLKTTPDSELEDMLHKSAMDIFANRQRLAEVAKWEKPPANLQTQRDDHSEAAVNFLEVLREARVEKKKDHYKTDLNLSRAYVDQAVKQLEQEEPNFKDVNWSLNKVEGLLDEVREYLDGAKERNLDVSKFEAIYHKRLKDLRRIQEAAKKSLEEQVLKPREKESNEAVDITDEGQAPQSDYELSEEPNSENEVIEPTTKMAPEVPAPDLAEPRRGVLGRVADNWNHFTEYAANLWKLPKQESGQEFAYQEQRLRGAAGIVSAIAKTLGRDRAPEVARAIRKSDFSSAEQKLLQQAIQNAIEARQDIQIFDEPEGAPGQAERKQVFLARQAEMVQAVTAAKHVSKEQKAEIMGRLMGALRMYSETEAKIMEENGQDIDDLINAKIRQASAEVFELITGESQEPKARKQSLLEYGYNALRKRSSREARPTEESKEATVQGFLERLKRSAGGRLAYRLGVGATLLTSTGGPDTNPENMLRQFEDGHQVEAGVDIDQDDDTRTRSGLETDQEKVHAGDRQADRELAKYIPKLGRVQAGDGITSPVVRIILAALEDNPKAFGSKGEQSQFNKELFAKRTAAKLADKADLIHERLSDKAIDQINIAPDYENGELRLKITDTTGHELTAADLWAKNLLENSRH